MRKQDPTYVLFAPQAWESQHSRTRAFAIELSKKGCRTIYINPPRSTAEIIRETAASAFYPLRCENIPFEFRSQLLDVWSPPMLPTFYRGSLTPGIDRWLFRGWFEKKIAVVEKPIVAIIAMPFWWDGYINIFRNNFSATLFDNHDPVKTYARNSAVYDRMEKVFQNLVLCADGIITHTEANFSNMLGSRRPSDVSLIRNGSNDTDGEREHIFTEKEKPLQPMIGTVGRITDNIDVPLLLDLAASFPECIVENIGTVGKYAHSLRTKKNISLVPPMSPEKLFQRIHSFNVGILPYHENVEGSPLRVYSLLSACRQVVSTNFPDSKYFRDVIHIASSHREFIEKVGNILHDRTTRITEKAMKDFMRRNAWTEKVNTLIGFCESHLDRK